MLVGAPFVTTRPVYMMYTLLEPFLKSEYLVFFGQL